MTDEPTRDAKKVIERWEVAVKELKIAERALNHAECEFSCTRLTERKCLFEQEEK